MLFWLRFNIWTHATAFPFFSDDEHSRSLMDSFRFFGTVSSTGLMRIRMDSMFATNTLALLMNQCFRVNETHTCDPGKAVI